MKQKKKYCGESILPNELLYIRLYVYTRTFSYIRDRRSSILQYNKEITYGEEGIEASLSQLDLSSSWKLQRVSYCYLVDYYQLHAFTPCIINFIYIHTILSLQNVDKSEQPQGLLLIKGHCHIATHNQGFGFSHIYNNNMQARINLVF